MCSTTGWSLCLLPNYASLKMSLLDRAATYSVGANMASDEYNTESEIRSGDTRGDTIAKIIRVGVQGF